MQTRHPPQRWSWGKKLAIAVTIALVANGLLYVREAVEGGTARLNRLKMLERRLANPLLITLAGARPWGVARLEHHGRRSGRVYRTPLWALPVPEGFVIALPFGREADWTQNLLHAGEGVLRYQDVDHRVGNPRIVPVDEARSVLPTPMRLVAGILGIRSVMRVDVLPGSIGEAAAPA